MARTKFTFEKRQREIARQQKQKDKAARRAEAKQSKDESEPDAQSGEPARAIWAMPFRVLKPTLTEGM